LRRSSDENDWPQPKPFPRWFAFYIPLKQNKRRQFVRVYVFLLLPNSALFKIFSIKLSPVFLADNPRQPAPGGWLFAAVLKKSKSKEKEKLRLKFQNLPC